MPPSPHLDRLQKKSDNSFKSFLIRHMLLLIFLCVLHSMLWICKVLETSCLCWLPHAFYTLEILFSFKCFCQILLQLFLMLQSSIGSNAIECITVFTTSFHNYCCYGEMCVWVPVRPSVPASY